MIIIIIIYFNNCLICFVVLFFAGYTWLQLVREFLVVVPDESDAAIAPLILLEQPALRSPASGTLRVWRSGETTKQGVGKRITLLVALDCRMRGKPSHQTDTGTYIPMSFQQAEADLHAATLQDMLSKRKPTTSNRIRKPPDVTLSTIWRYLAEATAPGGGTAKVGWTPSAYTEAVPEIYSIHSGDCVLRAVLPVGDIVSLI